MTNRCNADIAQIVGCNLGQQVKADVVPPHEHANFLTLLQRRFPMDERRQQECESWMKWSRQRFCEELLDSAPSANERQKLIMGFLESIFRVKLNFDLNDSKVEESTDPNIRDILDAHPELISNEQTDAVNILIKKILQTPTNWRGILFRAIEGIVPKLTSVNVFRYVWLAQLKHCREMIATVNLFGVSCTYLPSSRQLSTSSKKEEAASKKEEAASKKRSLSPDDSSVKQSNNAQAQKRQSKLLASLVCSECTLTPPDPVSHFVSFYVSRVLDQNIVQQRNKVEVLMDTGALAGNFVLRHVVVDLCLTSDVITSLVPVTVCSGLDNHCIDIYDSITLKLSYFCSILNNYASFGIQALILENSQLKVIVGVHTIRAFNLFHLLPKQMVLKSIPTLSAMTCSCCTSASQQVCMPCGCQPDGDFATPKGSPKANQSSQIVRPATSPTQVILPSIVFDSEKLLGHISPDDDEIDDHLNDSF